MIYKFIIYEKCKIENDGNTYIITLFSNNDINILNRLKEIIHNEKKFDYFFDHNKDLFELMDKQNYKDVFIDDNNYFTISFEIIDTDYFSDIIGVNYKMEVD